jgi:hypothetical protein
MKIVRVKPPTVKRSAQPLEFVTAEMSTIFRVLNPPKLREDPFPSPDNHAIPEKRVKVLFPKYNSLEWRGIAWKTFRP